MVRYVHHQILHLFIVNLVFKCFYFRHKYCTHEELALHNHEGSLWVAVFGLVLDLTDLVSKNVCTFSITSSIHSYTSFLSSFILTTHCIEWRWDTCNSRRCRTRFLISYHSIPIHFLMFFSTDISHWFVKNSEGKAEFKTYTHPVTLLTAPFLPVPHHNRNINGMHTSDSGNNSKISSSFIISSLFPLN